MEGGREAEEREGGVEGTSRMMSVDETQRKLQLRHEHRNPAAIKCSNTEGGQHKRAVPATWNGWEREREPVVVKGVSSMAGGSASFSAIAPVIAPSTYNAQ